MFQYDRTQAVVLGWLLFSIAAFIHFHYFWGNSTKLAYFMELGKVASGLVAVCCLFYLVWFMGIETFSI